ncbi:MAG: hypothetical protein ACYSRP_03695 [Planctomycetota bacterium]
MKEGEKAKEETERGRITFGDGEHGSVPNSQGGEKLEANKKEVKKGGRAQQGRVQLDSDSNEQKSEDSVKAKKKKSSSKKSKEAKTNKPKKAKKFKNHNVSDPGITLLE